MTAFQNPGYHDCIHGQTHHPYEIPDTHDQRMLYATPTFPNIQHAHRYSGFGADPTSSQTNPNLIPIRSVPDQVHSLGNGLYENARGVPEQGGGSSDPKHYNRRYSDTQQLMPHHFGHESSTNAFQERIARRGSWDVSNANAQHSVGLYRRAWEHIPVPEPNLRSIDRLAQSLSVASINQGTQHDMGSDNVGGSTGQNTYDREFPALSPSGTANRPSNLSGAAQAFVPAVSQVDDSQARNESPTPDDSASQRGRRRAIASEVAHHERTAPQLLPSHMPPVQYSQEWSEYSRLGATQIYC